ncbi:MAG: hypothetical protein IT381_10515 [Deltaproteobacteria bacterium]|nr:hypothetical protein [Deltaproteobacteria bacterium]
MSYRVPDEPQPGALAAYAVNPFWPFLAMMLGGTWVGLPWFVFNGRAIGSATKTRETLLAIVMPLAALALAFVGLVYIQQADLPKRAAHYLFVLVTALKLGCGYWLYLHQSRSFEIYEYFGGKVRQGMIFVIAGSVLRTVVVQAAFDASVWLGILVM